MRRPMIPRLNWALYGSTTTSIRLPVIFAQMEMCGISHPATPSDCSSPSEYVLLLAIKLFDLTRRAWATDWYTTIKVF